MSKLPTKKEFDYEKIGSWRRGDPYTIAFFYPRVGEPFCLKGGMVDISKWVNKNVDCSYVAYNTFFCNRGEFHDIVSDVPKHRTSISVNLIGEYEGDIVENNKMVNLGEKKYEWGTVPINAWRRKGYKMTVAFNDSTYKSLFEKVVKRTPRCFPKEFLPFCEDFIKENQEKPWV